MASRVLTDKEWIQRRPRWFERRALDLGRLWFINCSNVLTVKMTFGGFLSLLGRGAVIGGIALIPVAFAWFAASTKGSDFDPNAWWQAGAILVLQLVKHFSDRASSFRKAGADRKEQLRELSVALAQVVNTLDRAIARSYRNPVILGQLDHSLHYAMKCIESTVKLCLDKMDHGYFGVTLLTFEENALMDIRARSTTRPLTKGIPVAETIAFYAGKFARDAKVVHHFGRESFPAGTPLVHRSLSQPGKPPYESILLVPLPPTATSRQNAQQIRKGVVTIDAARPYEFLDRDIEIVVRIAAYLNLINLVLTNHECGVEPELP